MSKMLRSQTWNQKKHWCFFANFFWSNISSGNSFHKHDIYNLIYMIIHVKKTVEAKQCQKCRKYLEKKNNHKTCANKALSFFLFDLDISKFQIFFYKIQNLNKWQLVSVITHWTYTCPNPWDLRVLLNFEFNPSCRIGKLWFIFVQLSHNFSCHTQKYIAHFFSWIHLKYPVYIFSDQKT